MQKGDIANSYPRRNVVVLTPLLMRPLDVRRKWLRKVPVLDRYVGNGDMLTWMVAQARTFNTPWEVWSFDDEPTYDELIQPVARTAGDYIVEWQRWDKVEEASAHLRRNPDLLAVYDADEERKALWWQLHGIYVPIGKMP